MPPTERMAQAWAVYQRHGGDEMPGAQTAAARELGLTNSGLKSAVDGYRRHSGLPPSRPLRTLVADRGPNIRELIPALVERQEAVESRLVGVASQLAGIEASLDELLAEVRGMLARQPLVLEVRPSHRRRADGGDGGRRELRQAFHSLNEVAG